MSVALGECPSAPQDTCAQLQVTLARPALSPSYFSSLHTEKFGPFRTTSTKNFKSNNTASQSRGPTAPYKAASTHSKILYEGERRLRRSRTQGKQDRSLRELHFPFRLYLQRAASTHNYLLFLLKNFMRDLSFVLMKTTIFQVLSCNPGV